jgi:hypothetical protein
VPRPDWITFYYADPEPERFVDEVRSMAARGQLEKPETSLSLMTFLSRVMASNPRRIGPWLAELGDVQGKAREMLDVAVWLSDTVEGRAYLAAGDSATRFAGSPPSLLDRAVDHPAVLDALWGYYFATGDQRAVRRVVSALEHLSDHGAAAGFNASAQTEQDRARALNDALFQAAAWSLQSLMQQHPPLQAMCERLFDADDLTPNERLGLALTLEKVDPSRWRVEINPATGRASVMRRG